MKLEFDDDVFDKIQDIAKEVFSEFVDEEKKLGICRSKETTVGVLMLFYTMCRVLILYREQFKEDSDEYRELFRKCVIKAIKSMLPRPNSQSNP